MCAKSPTSIPLHATALNRPSLLGKALGFYFVVIGGKMPPGLSTRTDPFDVVVDFEQALRYLCSQ